MAISVNANIPLTADIVDDGALKRVPTLDEIDFWNQGAGVGGLPEGTTLDAIPDGTTRAAVAPTDLPKLAAYAVNDGKTGDAHATTTGNPHGTTAADVGAPTETEFDGLAGDVDANTASIAALDTRLDAAEGTIGTHTSAISALESDVEDLQGGTPGFRWTTSVQLIGNAVGFTNQPAAVTPWTATFYKKVALETASHLMGWVKIPTGATGASGSAVRPQYTTDLSGATGWTDITGMDIAIDAVSAEGKVSSVVEVPAGAKTQEFVLVRIAGVGGDATADPQITDYELYIKDSAAVSGATISLPIGLEDTADDTSGAGRLALTNAERTKLSNVPSDTNGSLATITSNVAAKAEQVSLDAVADTVDDHTTALAAKAEQSEVDDLAAAVASAVTESELTAALAVKANSADVTTALAAKAPLASPTFTGDPAGPTPAAGDNSTKLATTAFVKGQNYLTSVPSHTHAKADVTSLQADLDSLQSQISALSGGASDTQALLTVTTTTAVNLPDADVIYIEHAGVNANVRIPANLSKKAHVLVLLGNPSTVNVAGATGSGQSIKGASGGLTFASGTDSNAVSRVLIPDPDTTNFPNRWRMF